MRCTTQTRETFWRYAGAVCAVGIGVLIQALLWSWLGPVPGIAVVSTILLMAMLVGAGPALLAGLLGSLACEFFFIQPSWTMKYEPVALLRIGLTVALAGTIGYLSDALRASRARARAEAERSMFQAEAARNAESRLEAILQSMEDEVWFCDARHELSFGNMAAARTLGLAHPDEFCQPVEHWLAKLHLCNPDGTPQAIEDAPLLRALRGETLVGAQEILCHPDSGELRYRSVNASPLFDPQGRIQGATSTVRDITDLKRAEEAMQAANRQLAVADRRKDEFLAMLAHELRNPLAPVRYAVHILHLMGMNNPVLERQRALIDRQVSHMARLLDDLLDVSRITQGKIEPQRQPLQLLPIFSMAVEAAEPLIQTRDLVLHLVPPPENCYLEADPERLLQILGNILNNAAKYTEMGGQVWLEAARENHHVELRVRDTGIGISPEMLPRIFDLFAQADSSLARTQGGLGIGLTMVRRLVELHGGSIEARSAGLGRGSEFIVRLPALDETAARAFEEPPSLPPQLAVARRILVVDDEADSAANLAELLELWGNTVRLAITGPAALELARDFRPEVVLLDIGLPGMDGYEIARRLRQEYGRSQMLLVATTGYGQLGDREASLQAGFDHHLVKPLDLAALRHLLNQGL